MMRRGSWPTKDGVSGRINRIKSHGCDKAMLHMYDALVVQNATAPTHQAHATPGSKRKAHLAPHDQQQDQHKPRGGAPAPAPYQPRGGTPAPAPYQPRGGTPAPMPMATLGGMPALAPMATLGGYRDVLRMPLHYHQASILQAAGSTSPVFTWLGTSRFEPI